MAWLRSLPCVLEAHFAQRDRNQWSDDWRWFISGKLSTRQTFEVTEAWEVDSEGDEILLQCVTVDNCRWVFDIATPHELETAASFLVAGRNWPSLLSPR